ncbi:MAG: molecular chaperone TorD family protein [Coriobacteriaceae bacterium]|nr:molecular chaperone TorD family protein [Coriobacteriaceae bacterium]
MKAGDSIDSGNIDLIDLMRGRIATYRFLGRLYRKEVDQELLEQLLAMRYPVKNGNADLDWGYRQMHGYMCTTWERTLTELAIDYARVFLGNGTNAYAAAYPFESVHTSPKRLLMNDARDEVVAIYRANGVDKAKDWSEGEDHISLELEFETILIERTIAALEAHDTAAASELLETQLRFIKEHLLVWVPMLVAEMQKFAQTGFYQALGSMTIGFLDTDKELLEDLLFGDEK